MPERRSLPEIPDVVLEDEPYIEAEDTLTAAEAGNLVLKTFDDYRVERQQNQEPRWRKADRLYFGWVRQRYWEGSRNRRRSSLPIQVVFDHLESAYPHVASALFAQEPTWFEVMPDLGTTVEQAQAIQARLSYAIDQQSLDPDLIGVTGTSEFKRQLRSEMHYGNGYVEVGYDPIEERPFVEFVGIRDVFLPPDLGEHVDKAASWIKRKWMTVEELRGLRDHPKMDIPDDARLNQLAKDKAVDLDTVKQLQDSLRDITTNLGHQEQDPVKQGIEVLIFQSKDRIIWLLGRKWVAYNQPNPWGILTLVGSQYIPVLNSQYGMSFADMLESEQKLIQSATNAYLDEVALGINPPRTASHGALSTPQKLLAFRPGGLYKSQKPSEDFVPQFTGRVTQDVFVAIGAADQRAAIRSGVSQLMQQGVPTPSNANRTATGVRGQAQASAMRLFTPIDTFETRALVPALIKLHRILQIVEARGTKPIPGRAPDGRVVEVSSDSLAGAVSFKLSAATKMRAKEALMPVLPFLLQYLFNPQLVSQMQQIGKAPNITEIDRLVQESTGTAHRYEFFRDMTQQELQSRQQQGAPNQEQELAEKRLEAQTRLQIADAKNRTTLEAKEIDAEISAEKIALEVIKLLKAEGSEVLADSSAREDRRASKRDKRDS
jgi:hypothetical protein